MARRLKARMRFLWFDFWIGFYFDQVTRILYFCPLPMVVISFWFEEVVLCSDCGADCHKAAYDTGDGWILFWDCPNGCEPQEFPLIEWSFGEERMTVAGLREAGYALV